MLSSRWSKAVKKAERERGEGALPKPGWEKVKEGPLVFEPQHPPLDTGDWFKLTLQTTLAELSTCMVIEYAFANIVPLTETDPETGIVDVTFDIQRGEKVRINRIDISGNDPTWDKVQAGDPHQ